jgi:methyl-accepting chemotaxis protein
MTKREYARRKNPLVDRRSQLYLSLSLVLYLLAYTVLLLLIILVPSVLKFTSSSLSLEEQLLASREFLFIDRRVVPAVLVVVTAIGVHFLFITHRIFGPLKRLGGMFRAMEEGNWPVPFIRRRKDFHQNLFTSFNTALDSVGRDLERAKGLVAVSRDRVSAAGREGVAGGDAEGLREAEEACREALVILSRYFPDGKEKEASER